MQTLKNQDLLISNTVEIETYLKNSTNDVGDFTSLSIWDCCSRTNRIIATILESYDNESRHHLFYHQLLSFSWIGALGPINIRVLSAKYLITLIVAWNWVGVTTTSSSFPGDAKSGDVPTDKAVRKESSFSSLELNSFQRAIFSEWTTYQ